ncbi:MAG TPA: hypothetical protein VLH09_12275 [Bryobacteraceae bacterium]|nr:hypothetical protein [Bryobacteraceae bacterium]
MSSSEECARYQPARRFSRTRELVDNLPYILMGLCGSALLLAGLGNSPSGWLAAGAYLAYTLGGAIWIMAFVCPYCHYHGTRSCPCGYGWISARLTPKRPEKRFARQFRKHIPVIVPLWLIPVAAGISFYVGERSPLVLSLLVVFAVIAFVLLPLVARLYGCGHCPQKTDCPWMVKG